jgi:hypothetical protein
MITQKTTMNRNKSCNICGSETRGVLMFKCCPDCNSRKIATLAETGEKFCKACGLVLL